MGKKNIIKEKMCLFNHHKNFHEIEKSLFSFYIGEKNEAQRTESRTVRLSTIMEKASKNLPLKTATFNVKSSHIGTQKTPAHVVGPLQLFVWLGYIYVSWRPHHLAIKW